MKRAYAILWALDALLSALTPRWLLPAVGDGLAGQLVSARLPHAKGVDHWLCRAVDWVALRFSGEANHCQTALENYLKRDAAAPFE